jgi:hypothetical protein
MGHYERIFKLFKFHHSILIAHNNEIFQYGGSISNVLLSVDLPVVSDSDCNSAYAGPFDPNPIYPSVMFCAGAGEPQPNF